MLGPIIADIEGLTLSAEDSEFLSHPLIGGVILFSRNYAEPSQLRELVQSLKALPRSAPLLISVDHEGGRVQRFRHAFTELPAMGKLGAIYQHDVKQAMHMAQHMGWLMAAELLAYGIDYSYAPVLDLDFGVSKVIGDRAFHSQPLAVAQLTTAFIDGMRLAGMPATGKHFPGHGAVEADSHVAVPVDSRDFEAIWEADIVPYQQLISQNKLAAIMTAHVIYEQIDALPPCFSDFWLQRVLREQLNFNGVIFSDDLTMEGATTVGDYAARTELALDAGCDMLLVCNNRQAATQVLEHTAKIYTLNAISAERCQHLYGNTQAEYNDLSSSPLWQQAVSLLNQH